MAAWIGLIIWIVQTVDNTPDWSALILVPATCLVTIGLFYALWLGIKPTFSIVRDWLVSIPDPSTRTSLSCPLLALRARGDEASLAIGAGRWFDLAFRLIHRQSFDLLFKALWSLVDEEPEQDMEISYWTRVVLLGGGITIGVLLCLFFGWNPIIAVALFLASLGLGSLTLFRAPTLLLGLATGPEVLVFLGGLIIRVGATPPRSAAEASLQYVTASYPMYVALRHSLHESRAVRQSVAEWIAQHEMADQA